jgi:predicted transcriptional regulator
LLTVSINSTVNVDYTMRHATEIARAENFIPVIRARLATRLGRDGLRVKEIATALNITPAAVVQYIQGKRGKLSLRVAQTDRTVDALAEKVMERVRSGTGEGLRMAELLEAAEQILIASRGIRVLEETPVAMESEVVEVLRQRLQLELKASERCLESAVKFDDQYSKLLLRMIAADSMRHADVVSQIISWIEVSPEPVINLRSKEFLDAILQIEDKAGETSLRNTVRITHPVARLLLEWIDTDEKKHEKIIGKMAHLMQEGSI